MAFDANFPVTNSTPWSTLYAGLRANFIAIDAKFNPDPGWTTPTIDISWSAFYPPQYRKDGVGRVFLQGLASGGASATNNVFQLNSGYRPSVDQYFKNYMDSSQNRYVEFYINTSGYVGYNPAGVNDWIYLSGASFYVGA